MLVEALLASFAIEPQQLVLARVVLAPRELSDTMSLAMRCVALLAVAAAYTPPRRSPRSPGGRKPAGAPRTKRTPVVEPLEQWGNFDVGPHRMGVSTVSWGDATWGWRPDMIRKKKSSL